jgi:hypothetical protein
MERFAGGLSRSAERERQDGDQQQRLVRVTILLLVLQATE